MLSLLSIAVAAAYFALLENLCQFMTAVVSRRNRSNLASGNCDYFTYSTNVESGVFDTMSTAGWIIFLSLLVVIYQILAVSQLFLNFKLLHIKIPIRKSFWTVFSIIVG